MNTNKIGVLSVALGLLSVALANHTVVLSGSSNRKYDVSDDGLTWTQGDTFPIGFQGAVVPGDGFIYAQRGNYIAKYGADGVYISDLVQYQYSAEQLCLSADKVWIYAGKLENNATSLKVERYRLSDPSIGGMYINEPIANLQVRQMACGNDGYLYLSSRTYPGAYVYDVTLPQCELAKTYKSPNCTGGLIIDEALGKLNILSATHIFQYDLGNTSTYKDINNITGFNNPFASCKVGDMLFGGDWANCVVVKIGDNSATPVSINTTIKNLSGMLCLDNVNTGTKLPNITGVWYMNGGSGSSCNGANPGFMT